MFKKLFLAVVLLSAPLIASAAQLDPEEIKNIHMRNCLSNGGQKAICLCSYEKALQVMTLEDLALLNSQLAMQTASSGAVAKLEKVTRECAASATSTDGSGMPLPPPPPPPPPATLEPLPQQDAKTDENKKYFETIKQPEIPSPPPLPAKAGDVAKIEETAKTDEPKIEVPVEKPVRKKRKVARPAGYFGEYDRLFFDAIISGDVTAMSALSTKVGDFDVKNENGDTALIVATTYAQPVSMRFLLGKRADVNAKNLKNQTALHIASYMNRPDLVEILLEAKPKLNETYGTGYTPLILAILRQDQATVDLLLRAKTKLNQKLGDGNTELHVAATGGNPAILQMLVGSGSKINAVNKAGHTPLMVAAYTGNTQLVQTLLALGADPYMKDSTGRTALDLSIAANKRDVAGLLSNYQPQQPAQPRPRKLRQ